MIISRVIRKHAPLRKASFTVSAFMYIKNYSSCLFPGLLILLLMALASCSNGSGKNAAALTNIDSNAARIDSMAHIKDQIHAQLKHDRLDTLFTTKAFLRGFNGNVLIAQRGVVIYEKSFGFRDYEARDSLTSKSRFQIASLTKTFTAVAVLKLVEEGKVKLTDLITDYFPELPFRKVTIAMLLSHRSGIANYVNVYDEKVIRENLYPDNAMVHQWFETFDRRHISTAGRSFNYSNTNYVLLADLIEKVSGESYGSFLKRNIFAPLEMNDTWLGLDTIPEAIVNRTNSYSPAWKKVQPDYFDGVVGDKGIYSTTADLLKWYNGLIHAKVIKQETLDSAWLPRSHEKKGVRNYGYGFRMLCYSDTDKVVYHNGWWDSYNSLFYINPKLEYVIIVLGNKYNADIYNVQSVFNIMNGTDELEREKL
jgi:CubicO group peptidase (beta-lactamase class C family)